MSNASKTAGTSKGGPPVSGSFLPSGMVSSMTPSWREVVVPSVVVPAVVVVPPVVVVPVVVVPVVVVPVVPVVVPVVVVVVVVVVPSSKIRQNVTWVMRSSG